jgi:YD repeat-containing protein
MRKYLAIIIFSFLFISYALLMSGCSKKPSNYYRHIEIDGRYAIKGKYPIPDEMARKVNCYHFVYSDKDKLVEVEYLKSRKLSGGSYFGDNVAQVRIEYLEGYEKRIFQGVKGNPIADEEGVYSIQLKLDKNNHPIALSNYDKEGKLTKDKNGIAHCLWTLDKEGRRIKSIGIDRKGGMVVDAHGMFETRFKYDERGNRIERSSHGKDGQLIEDNHTIAIRRWKYDKQGNEAEMRLYGTNERLKEDKNGASIVRWKYNKQGNMLEARYYGRDEQLTEREDMGVAIVRWKYDEHGRLIKLIYLNEKAIFERKRDYL